MLQQPGQLNPNSQYKLQELLNFADQNLNDLPHEKKISILFGLDTIEQKIRQQEQEIQMFQETEKVFIKNQEEMKNNLRDQLLVYLEQVSEENDKIMLNVLITEEKLLHIQNRGIHYQHNNTEINQLQSQLEQERTLWQKMSNELNEIEHFMEHLNKQNNEILQEEAEKESKKDDKDNLRKIQGMLREFMGEVGAMQE